MGNASLFTLPVADSSRGRRYVALFDDAVARTAARFDVDCGLVEHTVPAGSPGVGPEVALLDRWERKRYISPLNHWAGSVARSSANAICAMGLAWAQPLSRYHHDPDLLRAVRRGLRAFEDAQAPSGEFVFSPLRYATIYGSHEMAWRLENLITAWFCVADALPPDERERSWRMLDRAMRFLRATPCEDPCNRGMVWTAVMAMCGRATGDEAYLDDARRMWDRVGPHVFQVSGEIREGVGPCSNYSSVSIEYLLRYRHMTGDASLDPIVLRAADWVMEMYTDQTVPFLGVSTRHELPDGGGKMISMLPALERYVDERAWYAGLAEVILDKAATAYRGGILKNGGICWISAANLHRADVADRALAAGETRPPWLNHYDGQATAYYTARTEGYGALLVLRSLPPRKGLQTWAARGSAPFIFPEIGSESTVRAWGFDLAGRDVTIHDRDRFDETALPAVTARHGAMWVTYLVGPRSLVVVHTLPPGDRETLWRASERHIAGYRIAADGTRIVAQNAEGALFWWGPAPSIDEAGLTIRFRDSAPTQVYAFSVDELRRGVDLPEDRRARLVEGDAFLVEWADESGHYAAAVNHGEGDGTASVRLPNGETTTMRLAPGQACVWRVR